MRARTPLFACLGLVAVVATGCDPDCADPSRIDGLWSMSANSSTDAASLTVAQGAESIDDVALLWGILPNGESTWDLKYIPANQSYTLIVGDQSYRATQEADADNCNRMKLRFSGDWASDYGAAHQFDWRGDLTWSGDEIGGTFTYEDTWTVDGAAGTISIPAGEIRGQRGASAADTGL